MESTINFTVPSGDAGSWDAEVAGSANANPNTDLFNYDLTIQGDTGLGPINPQATAPVAVPEPTSSPLAALVMALGLVVSRSVARDAR